MIQAFYCRFSFEPAILIMGPITNLGREIMISKFSLLALLSVGFLAYADAPYKKANDEICPTKENCSITNECKCWCSHKCGPRDKITTGDNPDKPVFLMSDPNGNYCYCNQWDIDNYNRCKVKEHDGNENTSNIIKK